MTPQKKSANPPSRANTSAEPLRSQETIPSDSQIKAKLWTKDFTLATLINFVLMLNYYMLMVVMTNYTMEVMQASEVVAAFSASILVIGALIARLVSGALMDRIGRKRFLVIGTICEVIFSALYLAGTALPLLFVVRFLHGFAYGACSTALGTIVTSITPASRKGEGVGYYMLSVTLGAALGPSIGIFLSTGIDFNVLFIVATVVVVFALVGALMIKVPEVGKPTEQNSTDTQNRSAKEEHANTISLRKVSGIHRIIEVSAIPISIVAGLIFFGYSSLLTFLEPYAIELGLVQAATVFFIVYAIIMFVTRPLTGRMFDRLGANSVMIPAFILFAVGMVVLGLATNSWMLLGSALFLGFGVGTVQSSGLAIAVRNLPEERLSLANSTFYIFLDIGVGLGPLLLGVLVPLIGYEALYFFMAAVAIVTLVIYLLAVPKSSLAPNNPKSTHH